jgi:hypothetical protein
LEEALVWQFRLVSRGLLAGRLLRETDLDELGWWHQYRAQQEQMPASIEESFSTDLLANLAHMTPSDGLKAEDFIRQAEEFRKPFLNDLEVTREFTHRFKTDVVWGKVAPIELTELSDYPIRIYGGSVAMWQEGKINRQLASLGSFFRLWFGKSWQMRIDRLRSVLGELVAQGPQSGSFIFGIARIPSCLGPAIFFDFEREFAVSPYTGSSSPGLVDRDRIIMRRQFLSQPVASTTPLLGHEFWHIWQQGPGDGEFSFLSSWSSVWKQDICAFFQKPRSITDLVFCLELSGASRQNYLVNWPVFFPAAENPEEYPIERLIAELRGAGLLLDGNNPGELYCPLFEEGKKWLISRDQVIAGLPGS